MPSKPRTTRLFHQDVIIQPMEQIADHCIDLVERCRSTGRRPALEAQDLQLLDHEDGVLALILYYALMLVLYPYLPEPRWFIVASLTMIGKAGLSLQLYRMTYAREGGGSGNFFSGSKTSHILLAQLLPLLLSLLVFSWRGLLAYGLVFLGAIGYRRFVYNKIDGHTGDTLGAYVEIAQLLYLLGLVVLG